jgi:uncharacterized protein YnzC (UPF0291/DUF896 family)
MNRNNKIKYDLLGEPFGTASAKLRKALLFQMAQELNRDICFRCKEKIDDISNFSIEHKIAWQSSENPIETFYDLNNIAFSHLDCNIAAANKKVPHLSSQGENHSQAILTNKQVSDIKKDIKNGIRNKDIVKEYGLSQRKVSEIRHETKWKYTK